MILKDKKKWKYCNGWQKASSLIMNIILQDMVFSCLYYMKNELFMVIGRNARHLVKIKRCKI